MSKSMLCDFFAVQDRKIALRETSFSWKLLSLKLFMLFIINMVIEMNLGKTLVDVIGVVMPNNYIQSKFTIATFYLQTSVACVHH